MKLHRTIVETIAVLEYSRNNTLKNAKLDQLIPILRRDRTMPKTKDVDGEEVLSNDQELLEEFLNQLEKIDTTPNKKYVPIMFRLYSKGGRRATLEDLPNTVIGSLNTLAEAKRLNLLKSNDELDGYRYQSIEDLELAAAHYQELIAKRLEEKGKAPDGRVSKGKYTVLLDNNDVTVVHLHDYTAAAYWGKNTAWCTAASPDASYPGPSAFENYSCKGPLIVIKPKNGEKKSTTSARGYEVSREENYQLNVRTHTTSEGEEFDGLELRDEYDNEYSYFTLFKRYPEVAQVLLHNEKTKVIASLIKGELAHNSPDEIAALVDEVRTEILSKLPRFIAVTNLKSLFIPAESHIEEAELIELLKDAIMQEAQSNKATELLIALAKDPNESITISMGLIKKYLNEIYRLLFGRIKEIYGKDVTVGTIERVRNMEAMNKSERVQAFLHHNAGVFTVSYKTSLGRHTVRLS